MFMRFLGRQPNAKEETPEQDVETNTADISKTTTKPDEASNNNNNEDHVQLEKIDVKIVSPEVKVDEIKVDMVEPPAAVSSSQSASGWIYAYDKRSIWPQELQDVIPGRLVQGIEARKVVSEPLHVRMPRADVNRAALLEQVRERASKHNNYVDHAALVKKDVESTSIKAQAKRIETKIQQATERREAIINVKKLYATESTLYPEYEYYANSDSDVYDHEYYDDTPQKRMDSAVRFRQLILDETSRRAREDVEYARMIASEVAAAEVEAAEISERILEQRLQKAEVRRNIVLDRKRLNAGRHGNYVKSVYLTNRYMERRSAQMIQHNLDAASFRREVKLEEIKSNARQQNLSAQFRACCAYRLQDAKWLNIALQTQAALTTAKMRRDQQLEQLHARLHEAEVHRAEVLAAYRSINSDRSNLDDINAKLYMAEQRREMYLYERVAYIQERAAIIRGRKTKFNAECRREGRQRIQNKLNEAAKRRATILERRRSICATRNWHAKVLAHRQAEKLVEEQSIGRQNIEGKLEAAAQRRLEYHTPVFAILCSLRIDHANRVLTARQLINERILARKEAFQKLRLSAINQEQMNKVFDRLARFKRVKSNREFMDSFYKQVITNTTTARQRGAELRRSLYQDAVKAAASETILRAEAARERYLFRKDENRYLMDMRMKNAEARRTEALSEKISSALWFLGKVAIANKRNSDFATTRRILCDESVANANLRRSIMLTRSIQKNTHRIERWHARDYHYRQALEQQRAELKEKQYRAEARREAALLRKIEVARCTSNRVTVARLEKRAEDVVDAAIRTAIQKTMTHNAETRRQEHLEHIQSHAAKQVSYARGVAMYQKELFQVRAEVTLEQSKLRLLQTSKRREDLLTQRKLGQSTLDQLQPYAGLQVIGTALLPHTA